ncbi:MAG: leucine-rich repeat domain-containing protein [Synergistaceae bacterium]|nr:leucine-rich repeat domain-containing protein [Synergistaceae bacterium]
MTEQEFTLLLRDYRDALADKKRFAGLVKDLMPERPLQRNLLLTLHEMNIHAEIEKAAQVTNAFAFRFVKRLCDEYGVSRVHADWAVSSWCVCYGKNILKKPCEIRMNAAKQGGALSIYPEADGKTRYSDLFTFRKDFDTSGFSITGFTGENRSTLVFPTRYQNQLVTAIAEGAFSKCGVREAVMTDGITAIGARAFSDCAQLKQVLFPQTLIEIGDAAFSGCEALAAATLPAQLERIGSYAFASSGIKPPLIPDSVHWIGEGAYSDCQNITEIVLPDRVAFLQDKTFMGCSALKKVTLHGGLESVGAMAFAGCVNLTALFVPDSVTAIHEGAFQNVHEKFILTCGKGSCAERYARKNSLDFQFQ